MTHPVTLSSCFSQPHGDAYELATTITLTEVRTPGVIQIALGLLFWTYNALI